MHEHKPFASHPSCAELSLKPSLQTQVSVPSAVQAELAGQVWVPPEHPVGRA
jgi:hypothetical protein